MASQVVLAVLVRRVLGSAGNQRGSGHWEPGDYVGENGDEVQVQIRFKSDGGWSDEDCQWPTSRPAPCQADNLQVIDRAARPADRLRPGRDLRTGGPVELAHRSSRPGPATSPSSGRAGRRRPRPRQPLAPVGLPRRRPGRARRGAHLLLDEVLRSGQPGGELRFQDSLRASETASCRRPSPSPLAGKAPCGWVSTPTWIRRFVSRWG